MIELVKGCDTGLKFFTGSGISVASGLLTRQQLWDICTKNSAVNIHSVRDNPQYIWRAIKELYKKPYSEKLLSVEKNAAHIAIDELYEHIDSSVYNSIITQNVDGLHGDGTIELHGSMQRLFCPGCNGKKNIVMTNIYGETVTVDNAYDVNKDHNCTHEVNTPFCSKCLQETGEKIVALPDVVLFGERIRTKDYMKALSELKHCKMLITTGTAFDVAPATTLLARIHDTVPIIDINPRKPHIQQIDYWVKGKAEDVLAELVKEITSS